MEPLIEFGDLVTGLQRLPEREQIIVVALINAHGRPERGDAAKIERLVAQTLIAAARDQRPGGQPEIPAPRVQKQFRPSSRATSLWVEAISCSRRKLLLAREADRTRRIST